MPLAMFTLGVKKGGVIQDFRDEFRLTSRPDLSCKYHP